MPTCRWCKQSASRECRMCGRPVCPKHAYVEAIKRRGRLAEDQKRVVGLIVMCRLDCGPKQAV